MHTKNPEKHQSPNLLIDTIRINGFRGIKNLEMSLPRVTVLIGANNAGKTSLLKAMQLALGDYARYLSDEDFHIGSDEKRAPEILVDIRIVPVNADGRRTQLFDDAWVIVFEDRIKIEANGHQFVAIRTLAKPDATKGGFDISRFILDQWPDFNAWTTAKTKTRNRLHARFPNISFVAIEAQRDIHQELSEKFSFVGKVLSTVKYNQDDISALESLINEVNDSAVDKSDELKALKAHLEQLNQSFQGSGSAEITPFPKKIRDLAKHFSVHFGETGNSAFSMEYHGMGTIPAFIFSDGEPKIIKDLKKIYDKIYAETDVRHCPNITILEDADFEGYLISSGFKSSIEAAIKTLDGEDAINQWIGKRDGTSGRSIKTNQRCPECDQFIYTGELRDYSSTEGYDKALKDILQSGKTKYAPAIAQALCKLDTAAFPPKIIEFFDKIKAGVIL